MGDPTLPTAQAQPLLYKADIADLKDEGIQVALLVGTEGLGGIRGHDTYSQQFWPVSG
jgi:hypothetical protein